MSKQIENDIEKALKSMSEMEDMFINYLRDTYPDASNEELISIISVCIEMYSNCANKLLNSNKEETPS